MSAVAVAKRHNVEAAGGHAGYEDCGFVGLRAAVGEEALLDLTGRNLGQFLGELDGLRRRVDARGVLQAVDLILDLAGNVGVGVTDADGQDAAEEIEVAIALAVPDV